MTDATKLPSGPPTGEVAATEAADVYASYYGQIIPPSFATDSAGRTVLLNPDVVLAVEDKKGLRSQLYDQMLVKDAKLAGLWTTRLNALLSLPWTVTPASDDPMHVRHAAIVQAAFAAMPRFDEVIARLAYGRWRSPSIQEIIWTDEKVATPLGPLWLIQRIEDRIPDRFLFDLTGTLRLRTSPWAYQTTDLPARKFLVYAPEATTLNPFGISLGMRAFYAWQQRLRVRIFHLRRLDKLGTPPLVFTSKGGDADPQAHKAFLNVKKIQNGADMHLKKDDYTLDSLKVGDSGAADFEALQRLLGDELAELVTGHVGSGGPQGSINPAAGQATMKGDIRADYQEADVRGVFGVLSDQLARWIIDVNVGVQPEGGYPRVIVPPEHLSDSAATLKLLTDARPLLGDRISKGQVAQKLGLTLDVPGDDAQPIGLGSPPPALGAVPGDTPFAQLAAAGVTTAATLDTQETARDTLATATERALTPLFAEMRAALLTEAVPPGKA